MQARPVQYYFLMTAISFPYGSTGLPVIFRSVDLWTHQRVIGGKYDRVSCFVCPPMATWDDAKQFRKSPGGVRVSVVSQNLFNGRVETILGRTGPLTLPQLCQNYMLLCVRIGKMTV